MIIARIFPKKSDSFQSLKPFFLNLGDVMDSGGWIRLFSLWTLIVAGIVLNMDFENRYVYWSWSGWESGFIKLIIASIIYFYFLNPNNLWIIGSKRLQNKEIIMHAVIAFILLFFGYVGRSSMVPNFFGLFPYFTAFLSCLLIFQFPLINGFLSDIFISFSISSQFPRKSAFIPGSSPLSINSRLAPPPVDT